MLNKKGRVCHGISTRKACEIEQISRIAFQKFERFLMGWDGHLEKLVSWLGRGGGKIV